jgi:GTP-binding protein
MSPAARLPVVALVGRPNVGKSTLFNRYAGYRRALVANQPGLTRDRIAERIEVDGRRMWLVDTAGLDPARDDQLDVAIQAQARSAVESADLILFIVDGKEGLVPEDESIARTLRRSGKPLALLVNKIDRPSHHDARMHEFYRLGIEPTFAVSAEHGGGAFDALEAALRLHDEQARARAEAEAAEAREAIAPEAGGAGAAAAGTATAAGTRAAGAPEQAAGDEAAAEDEDEAIRVAIVGRPNVGKSSLANRLAGEDRVVVSDAPGTTRDAVDIAIERDGQRFVFVDTAGLRKVGRRRGPGEHGGALMTLRALERGEVALLVIDAHEGIADQDAKVASLLREHGCAAVVLANKWDLVPSEDRARVLDDIAHGLRFMSDVPIVPVSARTGAGLGRLFGRLREVVAARERRIPTADLNRWLQDVAEKHPPAMASRGAARRPNKLFYASQVAVRPPVVVVVCSDPKAIQTSYVRFLENQLRESFGFEGTPVRVRLRARSGRRSGREEAP